jgi:transposase
MELLYDRVAGLDVHRDSVAACVRLPGPRGGAVTDKQRFKTTTAGLGRLAGWLAQRQVALVAMEATGVYWKGVYYALERDFAVWLCNAHHVKNVPGRKTDMSDAEWLADVAAHGMVRPSFVPPPPIRELRELTRYRKTQIDARAAEIQRLEKVLQDAGIKLTSVASKVLTQSGRAMVEALIAGERDPARLAALAKGKLRPRIAELTEALAGHFGSHHAVAARRILDHLDFLEASVAALTEQIDARTRPYAAVFELLLPVPGLDRLTIDVVIAETGADMDRFGSPAQLASWAGLCPGNHESAGKRRRVGTHPATSGCGVPWSRPPAPPPAPRAPTSPPSTARSPADVGPTRPPSRSPTACLTSSGTC